MPLLTVSYRSDFVGRKEIAVLYPEKAPNALPFAGKEQLPRREEPLPVLWLLHGGGDDFTAWPLNAMFLRRCERMGLMVVMPTIQDFLGYRNELGDFYRQIAEELPEFIGNLFPVSRKREDNFIAGLSYGGYLAYRVALDHPENYACVGSFSSPLDCEADLRERHAGQSGYPDAAEIPGSKLDILNTAAELKASGREMPRLFQACGTEDFTWQYNLNARAHFRALGCDHTWFEAPGVHNFDFWNLALEKYLDFLPLRGEEGRAQR